MVASNSTSLINLHYVVKCNTNTKMIALHIIGTVLITHHTVASIIKVECKVIEMYI